MGDWKEETPLGFSGFGVAFLGLGLFVTLAPADFKASILFLISTRACFMSSTWPGDSSSSGFSELWGRGDSALLIIVSSLTYWLLSIASLMLSVISPICF